MQVDVARADRLLTRLADLLRASLQASTRDMTSLREELKLLELYAQIMQERFAGRVTLTWSVADDALEAQSPRCCCSRCSKCVQTWRGAQSRPGANPGHGRKAAR